MEQQPGYKQGTRLSNTFKIFLLVSSKRTRQMTTAQAVQDCWYWHENICRLSGVDLYKFIYLYIYIYIYISRCAEVQ